ncbi:lysosomal alpha-mannosidase-like [Haemaphysalis longicornis]
MQHHDAITGTSTDIVASDYAHRLYQGMKKCERVINGNLVSLLDPGTLPTENVSELLATCHLLNQSDCPYTEENSQFSMVLYNPTSVPVPTYVRLPLRTLDGPMIFVTGPDGSQVPTQVVPLAPHRHGIPESTGGSVSSLVFKATAGPLGASVYRVNVAAAEPWSYPTNFLKLDEPAKYIENERYRVEFNQAEGLTASVLLRDTNISVKLRQTFAAYLFERNVQGTMSVPGHYIFSAYSEAQEMGDLVTYRVVKGPLVQEIHQIFTDYVSQVITLYRDSPFIEFTWTVGPLHNLLRESTQDVTGCDVVSRFESDLNSSGFNTDSNGWKNVYRTVKIEEDKLPIPSNYYPVVSWIYIKDQTRNLKMLILPDRPQGGTSLRNGHVELMLHRQHATNEALGNFENLGEEGSDGHGLVVRGTHRLFLGSPSEARRLMRTQALQLVYRPILVFAPPLWRPKRQEFSGLRWPLPSTVHILTLERLSAHQVLLRLEHLALRHKAVNVNVTRLFAGYRLENVRPVTLSANQFLPGPTRRYWARKDTYGRIQRLPDFPITAPEMTSVADTNDVITTIGPGQIVTFLAELVAE